MRKSGMVKLKFGGSGKTVGKESKMVLAVWNLWWQKEKLRLTSRSLKLTEAW